MDVMNILYGGELQARGFESTAALDRMAGKNAKRAGLFSAASNRLQAIAPLRQQTINAYDVAL